MQLLGSVTVKQQGGGVRDAAVRLRATCCICIPRSRAIHGTVASVDALDDKSDEPHDDAPRQDGDFTSRRLAAAGTDSGDNRDGATDNGESERGKFDGSVTRRFTNPSFTVRLIALARDHTTHDDENEKLDDGENMA